MESKKLVTISAFIVLGMWVASSIAGVVTGDYQELQLITPVMLILAGYLFARDFIPGKKRDKNGDD